MINNGMLTAAQGLRALQAKVDTIANNVANINTNGYKSKEAVFGEMLYRQMNNQPPGESAGAMGRTTEEMLRRGQGTILAATPTQFTQGTPLETGIPTDLMINGRGFFRIVSQDLDLSNVRYTRNGAFHLTPIDDMKYLVTANGEFVLNEYDEPIAFEANSTFQIQANGTIIEIMEDGEENNLGRIGIFVFPNEEMLVTDGNGNWMLNPQANPDVNEPTLAETGYTVMQGVLESSNVDLAKQMTDLIATQRMMSMVSRALTISDEMVGLANNLIRR